MITAIVSISSALLGITLGVSIGYLIKQDKHNDDSYSHGFTQGYDVAKGNFYNPSAKG